MRINEIKETKEVVIRTEYVAENGEVFSTKEECEKYEESALFEVSKLLKRLQKKIVLRAILTMIYHIMIQSKFLMYKQKKT